MSAIPNDSQLWDLVNEGCPYFCVECPNGERLFGKTGKNFPVQFGREVIASAALLNCPERVDWRQCNLTKEQESKVAEAMRKRFKPFAFNHDSDED